METAQSILRKAPPGDLQKNLKGMAELLKDDTDSEDKVRSKYQIPFQVLELNEDGEKPFLVCRYNKVGDKHRSPWTNKLYPNPTDKDSIEEDDLRVFEARLNEVWEAYKNLYYGHDSVGSVYLRNSDKGGAFNGLFGIQKKCSTGSWHSVSLVEVDLPGDETCTYRVETSVLITVAPSVGENTAVDISASISKDVTKSCKISLAILAASHIENIGSIIEANEIDLRSSLERVHVPKTKEVMDSVKKTESKMPTAVNPLMGMIMESKMLKKKG